MKLNGIFTNIFIRVKTHVTKSDWWGAFDNFRKPITKGNGENLMNSVNRKLLDWKYCNRWLYSLISWIKVFYENQQTQL